MDQLLANSRNLIVIIIAIVVVIKIIIGVNDLMHQYHDQEVQQVGELLANASKLRQLFSGEDYSSFDFPVFILVIFILDQFYWQKFTFCQRQNFTLFLIPVLAFCWTNLSVGFSQGLTMVQVDFHHYHHHHYNNSLLQWELFTYPNDAAYPRP